MVYFIQEGETGPVKIGVTADPCARLRDLQVGNPRELRLIGFIDDRGGDDFDLEERLHECFRLSRLRGEWFEPSRWVLRLATYVSENGGRLPEDGRGAWFKFRTLPIEQFGERFLIFGGHTCGLASSLSRKTRAELRGGRRY